MALIEIATVNWAGGSTGRSSSRLTFISITAEISSTRSMVPRRRVTESSREMISLPTTIASTKMAASLIWKSMFRSTISLTGMILTQMALLDSGKCGLDMSVRSPDHRTGLGQKSRRCSNLTNTLGTRATRTETRCWPMPSLLALDRRAPPRPMNSTLSLEKTQL